MEIQGKIVKFLNQETGQKKDGSGEWVKQSIVVHTDDTYNNVYCFELFGAEKVDNLNKYNKAGDLVKVEFNVNTSEYNGKFYTTLQAWKISKESSAPTPVEQIEDLPY